MEGAKGSVSWSSAAFKESGVLGRRAERSPSFVEWESLASRKEIATHWIHSANTEISNKCILEAGFALGLV